MGEGTREAGSQWGYTEGGTLEAHNDPVWPLGGGHGRGARKGGTQEGYIGGGTREGT